MANGIKKSAFERLGCHVSTVVSDIAANPLAQIGVIAICGLWFALGLNTNVLTAVLSVLAITLTQMVLNRQNEREADAHRRDVAMHAKIDELVIAMQGARNDMVGIEELEEEEIQRLKDEAKQAIDDAGPEGGDADDRDEAKREIDEAGGKPA
ncbi:MAG: low affinity iron permease family protein [Sphingomicrobium sp.]